MFTGIIKRTAAIKKSYKKNGSLFLEVETPKDWDLSEGDSVATNGVCLTVKELGTRTYTVELMAETLLKTSFGSHVPACVNLERPLKLSDLLDGHLVQGHVDKTGTIEAIVLDGDAKTYTISFPRAYSTHLVEKGSVTVDGISLTVASLSDHNFSVSLVAYTQKHTTLGDKKAGELVNLEFDMIAKYVAKLLEPNKKEL